MTDLLQAAVQTGTGRAAQIGRPVAGKTGTTSSNKDGWFVGFSSGVTTGVWMGRDDARAVRGLQGGRAPCGRPLPRSCAMRFSRIGPSRNSISRSNCPMADGARRRGIVYGEPEEYYFHREHGQSGRTRIRVASPTSMFFSSVRCQKGNAFRVTSRVETFFRRDVLFSRARLPFGDGPPAASLGTFSEERQPGGALSQGQRGSPPPAIAAATAIG